MFDDTRKRIQYWEDRVRELKEAIEVAKSNNEDTTDLQIELYESEEEVKYAWADDELEEMGLK